MLSSTSMIVRQVVMLPAAALLFAACSSSPPAPNPPAPSVATTPAAAQPVAPAPRPDATLERRIGALELALLEKDAQVTELEQRLDEARREVVRSMARMQSLATRAEAASAIAEAELALQSLPAGASERTTGEIRELTQLSSAEFEKANFGGALYLAGQAKGAAMSARGQLAEGEQGPLLPDERSLTLPLQLETTTGANVRSGPGTGFGVLFTLPPQSHVVAYSSAEQWLRIVDDSGRRGWISQGLMRGRP